MLPEGLADADLISIQEVRLKVDRAYAASISTVFSDTRPDAESALANAE